MFKPPFFDDPTLPDLQSPESASRRETVMAAVHELAASLGRAIDAKDPHTLAHSEEVAEVARVLARSLGLSSPEADIVHVAGHLHDIGKIGVPDAVLCKPGRLTEAEWDRMRAHPAIGAEILAPLSCLSGLGVVEMVAAHHERFDGGGYPLGLAGRAIPIGARIIAVADSLSAMLQSRPYRPAMTFEAARAELLRCRGAQFDPDVVAAFLAAQDVVRQLCRSLREKDRPLFPGMCGPERPGVRP
ncbi:metal dependent phosphohydrolase [Solidesulfovibrio fructosivorans JJ]]|uniref:Metal dependent phosphohydrolase n=1 Tax=Solidesulfovibrio fructosivorans JJ] TaxID=596151 RepID=E1JU11_SOLFR|nr:HD-GYP domain-containing protein [Solidesulfovibrio fructosivorans]EFL52290.1 metal dependent phosphohydrolase [Solidesulfovibrio fructosivorans JJ]]